MPRSIRKRSGIRARWVKVPAHAGAGAVVLLIGKLIDLHSANALDTGGLLPLVAWPLAYAGQFMICTGVVRTLRRDHSA